MPAASTRDVQRGQLITALSGRAVLEYQKLILIDVLADFLDHRAKVSANRVQLLRRDISVAQQQHAIFKLRIVAADGNRPMIFFFKSAS